MKRSVVPTAAALGCLLLGLRLAVGQDLAAPAPARADQEPALLTVAESSNFEATGTFTEVEAFVDRCAELSEHVTRHDFGVSVEGRPMISVVASKRPYDFAQPDDRLRVLLIGNIHSGECAGKEALLMLLRDLTQNADHPWLRDAVLVLVPNYNVDANERMGPHQRPGQVGPAIMGQHANTQQLDLNEDFVKLEAPESRSLVALIDQFDPHLFIDCQTTNGSRHRYLLTYDVPHNPAVAQPIRDFLRNEMMPQITATLEAESIPTFYCGDFDEEHTMWTTSGHEPRYGAEYVALRGRLSLLAEAYAYATYRQRIMVTKSFVEQSVQYVLTHADKVKQMLDGVRRDQIEAGSTRPNQVIMHLDARAVAAPEKLTVRGFEMNDPSKPMDYEVAFVGNYEPLISEELPFCYLIPKDMVRVAGRLAMHGIDVEQLKTAVDLHVELNTITQVQYAANSFQRHHLARLETDSRIESRRIEPGTFVVRTGQALGRLGAYLLEPESRDSLATWNFMDRWLAVGGEFPILQVRQPIEINSEPVGSDLPLAKLHLADVFGPSKISLTGNDFGELHWVDDETYGILRAGRTVLVDAQTGAERPLELPFTEDQLRAALSAVAGLAEVDMAELSSMSPEVACGGQRLFVYSNENVAVVYDAQAGVATRLDLQAPAELLSVNPAGNLVAFVRAGNLMVFDGTNTTPVTEDGGQQILNGKLDWVYQEELYGRGNYKGYWWSPDSTSIAFLKLDETPVHRYTVTDHIPFRGRDEITPYPKAGDPLPIVNLGVYSVESKQTVWAALESYSGDFLISQVGWRPSGDLPIVQIQNRQQTWLDLCEVEPATGAVRRLFRDETKAWIESPGNPVWLADGGFLWLSPRSGYRHIYHYDSSGNLIGQVTSGPWEVRSLLGVSKNLKVFFEACPESPIRVQTMSIDIDGNYLQTITDGQGSHRALFNDSFSYFIDHHSQISEVPRIRLCRADGSVVRPIDPNLNDFLPYVQLSTPEFVTVPIDNESDPASTIGLAGVLIKPPDFDAQKKYPVLVHVYAGPQAPRVRDQFLGPNYLWHQFLAQQGYVIWMCDNRSASYASSQDVWPIHRDLGRRELADIELGLKWLKSHAWVDASRIGIWGWSYGGYMTAYAMTHSTSFKAGISGAPVTDWRNYDAIYTERYMDTPQDNPAGYDSSSVVRAAKDLHGRMLLVHGSIDDNVHLSNSLQLAHELQKHGIRFDMMVYPKNRHGITQLDQQLHLYQMMTQFLLENL